MIRNLTKNNILSKQPFYAVRFTDRARGMICRRFDGFDAMVFEGCRSIHTMFMTETIDVLFYDFDNRVARMCHNLKPWRPMIFAAGARGVVEFPSGRLTGSGVELGDIIDLNAESVESGEKRYIDKGIISVVEGAAVCRVPEPDN